MHFTDLVAVVADKNPVIPCFVEIAGGSDFGAGEAGQRVEWGDVVEGDEHAVAEPHADQGDDRGPRKDDPGAIHEDAANRV